MGVHGLATYLRENRRALSTTIELPSKSNSVTPIVVDGWSFIYNLYNSSGLSWVYGGEYRDFEELVKSVVEAWIQVGLRVHFVFDGAYPDLKFPTLITRLAQSHIQPALLFFRTSPVARATPRSLNESRILPPLSYTACIHALKNIQRSTDSLELHFADEEGDPYAVELAARIKGYVVGNDSDFVVLNAEGYRGYIPIDEMVWKTPPLANPSNIDETDDGEFQMVRRPKLNPKTQNESTSAKGLLPPSGEELELYVTCYSPSKLASHLHLPVTLLPLLGALVGNDFSSQTESTRRRLQSLFFERHFSLSRRIEHAAGVMRSVLSPTANRRKAKHAIGSVMDLIDRTVNALLARSISTMGPGEIEGVINGIVEATLQYAIPKSEVDGSVLWSTKVCALHKAEACPFLPMVSRRLFTELQEVNVEDEALLQVRERIIDSYRRGEFSPKNMNVLSTSSSWPKLFLESPDIETVSRSITRPIREWIYSILDDAVGLPDPPPVEGPESDSDQEGNDGNEEDDEDQLVDVIEEDSGDDDCDFLAPLKGELERLHPSEDEVTEPSSVCSHRQERARPPIVTEYVRRGTRIAPEAIAVTPLHALLESIGLSEYNADDAPLMLLRPDEDRLTVMLRLLKSDTPSIRSLPPTRLATVLAIRWIATVLHDRAQESGSQDRDKERWTAAEARCFIASFFSQDTETLSYDSNDAVPDIVDRNVQLMAQALATLEAVEQLAEVLLLKERVPSVAHLLSGKRLHTLLNNPPPLFSGTDDLWAAVEDTLTASFQEERRRQRPKKAKPVTQTPPTGAKSGKGTKKPTGQGFYALLSDE